MKKTYYFPHDYHARHDPKLEKLRMEFGPVTDGIYWNLIEMLYEENGYLSLKDIPLFAKSFNTDEKIIKKMIEESELFFCTKTKFYSKSLLERLIQINVKLSKLKISGKLGGLANARKMLQKKEANAQKKSSKTVVIKGKEIKEYKEKVINTNVNTNKDINKIDIFIIEEEIYNYYAKTIKAGAKQDAITNISKLLKMGITKENLIERINAYAKQLSLGKQDPQFYIQANNFFGERARYKDFEPVKEIQYQEANKDCKMCKGIGKYLIQATGQVKICECRIKN